MKLILIIISTILLSNCSKKVKFFPNLLPPVLFFKVVENNDKLADSVLDKMNLYYLENNNKIKVLDFSRGTNEGNYNARTEGVQASREVGIISGEKKIKTFYLEYPNSKQDTIIIDYELLSEKEAEISGSYYKFIEIKYNNKEVSIDSLVTQIKLFKFYKN
jgi:hypothetical protein